MKRTSNLGLLALCGAVLGLALAAPAVADLGDGSTLVGLTDDGTVYFDSSADSYCHWIPDGATLTALGYDQNSITWYSGALPCTVDDPLPAIAPPAAAPAPAASRSTQSVSVTLTPVIGKALASPATAHAGKAFVVSFPVTRSDNGAELTSGTAVATTSLAGSPLEGVVQFTNGTASVKLTLPGSAKGKTLEISLSITSGTASAARTATFHIA